MVIMLRDRSCTAPEQVLLTGEKSMRPQAGTETMKAYQRREAEGFFQKYLAGDSILDIGYRGGKPDSVPVTDRAIGIELDYPGYDGKHLPFESNSQDSVFASHSLEHIDDYKAVLADWYRVLKLGGYLIIAVPHRDLYERKPTLPSRCNADHKRFYTPASLLSEIEESLPVGAYRVRSLKDIDDGFDYALLPHQHPTGSYEIEIVIQKIGTPIYASCLRQSSMSIELSEFYAKSVCRLLQALRDGRDTDALEIVAFLKTQALPSFAELQRLMKIFDPLSSGIDMRTTEPARRALTELIAASPFDEQFYIAQYSDIAALAEKQLAGFAHSHYVNAGYFAGRLSGPHS
jgi:hypothetical protein